MSLIGKDFQNQTATGLALSATFKGIIKASIFFGLNFLVSGINPYKMYTLKNEKSEKREKFMSDMDVADKNIIPGLPPGTKYTDLPKELQEIMFDQSQSTIILLDLVKFLGLSDKTTMIIEQDIRN